jgi:hypothetical protein
MQGIFYPTDAQGQFALDNLSSVRGEQFSVSAWRGQPWLGMEGLSGLGDVAVF